MFYRAEPGIRKREMRMSEETDREEKLCQEEALIIMMLALQSTTLQEQG